MLLLLTVPISWPPVTGGWGDVAMLQAVAGLSPPYCTPPGHPGGKGRDDLPSRTVGNPEPQPIARKVGRGLKGWQGTEKVGRGLKGWQGTEKVGMGLKGWQGTETVTLICLGSYTM